MKKLAVLSILFISFAFVAPIQASAATNAGVKPGSFFYFFDTTFENIGLFFTFNSESKAKKALEYADERLAEIEAVAEGKNPDAVKVAITNYESNIALATEKSKEVKDKGQAESLFTSITDNASKNQEVLSAVLIKVPEEAKEAIKQAIEASRKGQEEATKQISELKGEVEKLKKEVAELKQEKTEKLNDSEKIKLEAEKAKLEVEIANTKAEAEKLRLKAKKLEIEKSIKNETNTTKIETEKQIILPQQHQIISQQIQQTPSLQSSAQLIEKIFISINSQNIGETTAQIEWTTSELTESKLYLSGGGINSQQYSSKNGYTTRHIVSLLSLQPMTEYSYQITATGNNGFADYTGGFKTKTPAPTLQMTPEDGSKIVLEGIGYKLTWKSTYATQCTASGNWDGNKNTSGEYPLSFSQSGTYEYTLTCAGINGENISKSVNLKIIKSTPEIYLLINGQRVNSYTAKIGEEIKIGVDAYSEGGESIFCVSFKIGELNIPIRINGVNYDYGRVGVGQRPIYFDDPYIPTSIGVVNYSTSCYGSQTGAGANFSIPITVIE